jgi:thioredoxin-like negative regulator of GroEL
LTDDNYDDYVGGKKYVIVKFYTKWCNFCRMLSPEYDKLVDKFNSSRKDIIIGRLEAGSNDIISNKYGINQFPIVAMFKPGSKKIFSVFQGIRQSDHMADWINHNCPKIEIKEDDNNIKINNSNNNEALQINIDFINNKSQLTDKKEYIKQQFFEVKNKLDEIEKHIKRNKIKNSDEKRYRKIRFSFDFSFNNIFVTIITLSIIFAFYKTGRKLLINAGQHNE